MLQDADSETDGSNSKEIKSGSSDNQSTERNKENDKENDNDNGHDNEHSNENVSNCTKITIRSDDEILATGEVCYIPLRNNAVRSDCLEGTLHVNPHGIHQSKINEERSCQEKGIRQGEVEGNTCPPPGRQEKPTVIGHSMDQLGLQTGERTACKLRDGPKMSPINNTAHRSMTIEKERVGEEGRGFPSGGERSLSPKERQKGVKSETDIFLIEQKEKEMAQGPREAGAVDEGGEGGKGASPKREEEELRREEGQEVATMEEEDLCGATLIGCWRPHSETVLSLQVCTKRPHISNTKSCNLIAKTGA